MNATGDESTAVRCSPDDHGEHRPHSFWAPADGTVAAPVTDRQGHSIPDSRLDQHRRPPATEDGVRCCPRPPPRAHRPSGTPGRPRASVPPTAIPATRRGRPSPSHRSGPPPGPAPPGWERGSRPPGTGRSSAGTGNWTSSAPRWPGTRARPACSTCTAPAASGSRCSCSGSRRRRSGPAGPSSSSTAVSSPPPPTPSRPRPAALGPEPAVLLVDTFERCQDLEVWLRERFLPRLRQGALAVLAGRDGPDPSSARRPRAERVRLRAPLRVCIPPPRILPHTPPGACTGPYTGVYPGDRIPLQGIRAPGHRPVAEDEG